MKNYNRQIKLNGEEIYFLYFYICLFPDELAQLLRPSYVEKILLLIGGIKNRFEILKNLKTRFRQPANSYSFF